MHPHGSSISLHPIPSQSGQTIHADRSYHSAHSDDWQSRSSQRRQIRAKFSRGGLIASTGARRCDEATINAGHILSTTCLVHCSTVLERIQSDLDRFVKTLRSRSSTTSIDKLCCMQPIDAADKRPPFKKIANSIRAAILTGEFEPGAQLPPGRELAEFFGVAPMTVHQAVRILRDEGFVTSRAGSGVFVSKQP